MKTLLNDINTTCHQRVVNWVSSIKDWGAREVYLLDSCYIYISLLSFLNTKYLYLVMSRDKAKRNVLFVYSWSIYLVFLYPKPYLVYCSSCIAYTELCNYLHIQTKPFDVLQISLPIQSHWKTKCSPRAIQPRATSSIRKGTINKTFSYNSWIYIATQSVNYSFQ